MFYSYYEIKEMSSIYHRDVLKECEKIRLADKYRCCGNSSGIFYSLVRIVRRIINDNKK